MQLYGAIKLEKQAHPLTGILNALKSAPKLIEAENLARIGNRAMEYIPAIKSHQVSDAIGSGALHGAQHGAAYGAAGGGLIGGGLDAYNQSQNNSPLDYGELAKHTAIGAGAGSGIGAGLLGAVRGGQAGLKTVGERVGHLDDLKGMGITDHGLTAAKEQLAKAKNPGMRDYFGAVNTAAREAGHQADVGLLTNSNGGKGNISGEVLSRLKALGGYNTIDAGQVVNAGMMRSLENPRIRQSINQAGIGTVKGVADSHLIKPVGPKEQNGIENTLYENMDPKDYARMTSGDTNVNDAVKKWDLDKKIYNPVEDAMDDDPRRFLRDSGGFYPNSFPQYVLNTYGAKSKVRELFHHPESAHEVPFNINTANNDPIAGLKWMGGHPYPPTPPVA